MEVPIFFCLHFWVPLVSGYRNEIKYFVILVRNVFYPVDKIPVEIGVSCVHEVFKKHRKVNTNNDEIYPSFFKIMLPISLV